MTTDLYSMREKIIGLGRLLYKPKLTDTACVLVVIYPLSRLKRPAWSLGQLY